MRYILCLLILCLPSFVNAQTFNSLGNFSDYYPNVTGTVIPPSNNDGLAILEWTYRPFYDSSANYELISARIIPSISKDNLSVGPYGYYGGTSDLGYRTWYTVCSSSDLYSNTSRVPDIFLTPIQDLLSSRKLGTVEQRAAYIAGFKAKPPQIVNPGDILGTFTKMLGPWAYALVGMWIALIGLDLGTRNMKKVAGEAAKLERSARRTEINRQIKNDQTARVYQRKLRSMSHFLYTYTDRDDFYKDVRKRFKQTSADYAEYKASKGWIL